MNEAALLQILSIAGIAVGVVVAGLGYWSITQELKRPEPNNNLAQALWVVVAAALLIGLFGAWGQVQLYNLKKNPVAATASPVTGQVTKAAVSAAPVTVSADSEVASLKAKLDKLEKNLAKYRALQEAFAKNRDKWQDVLDRASVIAGPIRPDVQSELKQIREQLGVKLVDEDK
jgi:hypothetical protein